jgi:hypothetical protein
MENFLRICACGLLVVGAYIAVAAQRERLKKRI